MTIGEAFDGIINIDIAIVIGNALGLNIGIVIGEAIEMAIHVAIDMAIGEAIDRLVGDVLGRVMIEAIDVVTNDGRCKGVGDQRRDIWGHW